MNRLKAILGAALLLCVAAAGRISLGRSAEKSDISDMLLYEHDSGDFFIDVRFGGDSDKIELRIVDSRKFDPKDDPEPIRCSTVKTLEIDYASLPLEEVSDECAVIRSAPISDKPWTPDGKAHDLYILDDKYYLFQYCDDELYGSRWWQPMFEADRNTQAEIPEHADCKAVGLFRFGPRYHATDEGQLQCVYKYGNCVYYRQVN